MKEKLHVRKAAPLALLAGGAFSAGIVNGVLGTGAGTVFYLLCRKGIGGREPLPPKDAFASAMAAVLPISLISLATYPASAADGGNLLTAVVLPAAAGGAVGAALSGKIRGDTLKKIFGAIAVFGGMRMILR